MPLLPTRPSPTWPKGQIFPLVPPGSCPPCPSGSFLRSSGSLSVPPDLPESHPTLRVNGCGIAMVLLTLLGEKARLALDSEFPSVGVAARTRVRGNAERNRGTGWGSPDILPVLHSHKGRALDRAFRLHVQAYSYTANLDHMCSSVSSLFHTKMLSYIFPLRAFIPITMWYIV